MLGAAAALAPLAAVLSAALPAPHEDDPKLLGRLPLPAHAGAGWSAAAAAGVLPPPGAPAPSPDPSLPSPAPLFDLQNVSLLAWVPPAAFGAPSTVADCWGWTSPAGREYALVCHADGTTIVEVTQPSAPVVVATVPAPPSMWRDAKTYGHHAYVVGEGGGGIQVLDLSRLDEGLVELVGELEGDGTSPATHNVAVDAVSGRLYRTGGADHGLRIYDLADPAAPALVGEWSDRYVHDAQVVTYETGPHAGRQIAYCAGGFNDGWVEPGISVLDVTDPANVVHVGQASWPGAQYAHQCWLSEDRQWLYANDEVDETLALTTTTYVLDVADPDAPRYEGSFTNRSDAVGHNLFVLGDALFQANYRSGLRVFDTSADPVEPAEVAWFDTDPESDAPTFNGAWGVYPFLPSGTVLVSDMERGLFVLRPGPPAVSFQFPGGVPEVLSPDGQGIVVLPAGDLVPGTAQVHWRLGDEVHTLPLAAVGGGKLGGTLPALPCGAEVAFWLTGASSEGIWWIQPPVGVYEAEVALAQTLVLAQEFDSASGWKVGAPGDDATAGTWVRGDPLGTEVQPEDDAPDHGGSCWYTGAAAPGAAAGDDDVDGGTTTLVSPPLDLSAAIEPRLSYWRWYSNDEGTEAPDDVLRVELSGDGGATWALVEELGPTGPECQGGWLRHEVRVLDLVPSADTVQLRVVVSDLGSDSVVEAAFDDFQVLENVCPDCDVDRVSDHLQIASGAAEDADDDGAIDACQPFSATVGVVSASEGGAQSLHLDAGPTHAGAPYLVLGSTSGTTPPTPFGGVLVPLTVDPWTLATLATPNLPPLIASFGTLDAQGRASAGLTLPPATLLDAVGAVAHHAFVVLDPATSLPTLASNAVPLLLGE